MQTRKRKNLSDLNLNSAAKQETFASKVISYFQHIEFPQANPQTATNTTTKTTTTTTSTNVNKQSQEPTNDYNAKIENKEKTEKKEKKPKKRKTQQVDHFNERTEIVGGTVVMNPYKNPMTMQIFVRFMKKFFSDNNQRVYVLGINPSRFGAGITGIPFTEPKNIKDKLGIDFPGLETVFTKSRREPSGEFIHSFIEAYGGPAYFFSQFYITSTSPLGFTKDDKNYNFYDSKELQDACMPFIVSSLTTQMQFGASKKVVICLGTGKLATFLHSLNQTHKFFDIILEVEHPRYIVQYKQSSINEYMDKYKRVFAQAWKLSGLPDTSVQPTYPSSDESKE